MSEPRRITERDRARLAASLAYRAQAKAEAAPALERLRLAEDQVSLLVELFAARYGCEPGQILSSGVIREPPPAPARNGTVPATAQEPSA